MSGATAALAALLLLSAGAVAGGAAGAAVEAPAPKVNVTLYAEALCPYWCVSTALLPHAAMSDPRAQVQLRLRLHAGLPPPLFVLSRCSILPLHPIAEPCPACLPSCSAAFTTDTLAPLLKAGFNELVTFRYVAWGNAVNGSEVGWRGLGWPLCCPALGRKLC